MLKILINNKLGAGDHVNVLPALNFLSKSNIVYTHVSNYNNSIYANTNIIPYNNEHVDMTIDVTFRSGQNIPAIELVETYPNLFDVEKIRNTSGIILDKTEEELILNRPLYVNIFPYTTIKQKVISSKYIRIVAEYIKVKGYSVYTSYPVYDINAEKYDWDIGCEFHKPSVYFSREWILDIYGAHLNICCDGGPFNVSAASRRPTIGLLTIADKTLSTFHPTTTIVQSENKCSPCFKSANYNTGYVIDCLQDSYDNYCGNNFNINKILEAIDTYLS